MKQHITKKQWNQINDNQKEIFSSVVNVKEEITPNGGRVIYYYNFTLPDIGQMLQFICRGNKRPQLTIYPGFSNTLITYKGEVKTIDSLCDALWEACKYKLKNK